MTEALTGGHAQRIDRALELIAIADCYIYASKGPGAHKLDDPAEGYQYVRGVLWDVWAALSLHGADSKPGGGSGMKEG